MVDMATTIRESTRTVGGSPTELTMTLVAKDDRITGWYESRRPHSTFHERVQGTLWGFRSYVLDDRPVTECVVLPHERNATYVFIPVTSFTPEQQTHDGFGTPKRRPRRLAQTKSDLDEPTLDRPFG